MFPLEFQGELNHEETRVMGQSYSEGHMIVAWVVVSHWVTVSFRNTKVLHQTLNPTAKLWRKTLYHIKVDLVLHRTSALVFIFVCLFKSIAPIWCYLSWARFKSGFTLKFGVNYV